LNLRPLDPQPAANMYAPYQSIATRPLCPILSAFREPGRRVDAAPCRADPGRALARRSHKLAVHGARRPTASCTNGSGTILTGADAANAREAGPGPRRRAETRTPPKGRVALGRAPRGCVPFGDTHDVRWFERAKDAEERCNWDAAIALVSTHAECFSADFHAHDHHLWHLDLLARAGRMEEPATLGQSDPHARRRLNRLLRDTPG
jgi:hypothetical protein